MNVRMTPSYYISLNSEAKRIVKALKGAGIRAYITGGLALDFFTKTPREHRDIDILIDGFSNDLVGQVDAIMRNLGYTAIQWGGRKDGTTGIMVYEKEAGAFDITVDLFFKSFNAFMPYFGEVFPCSEDEDYLHPLLVFGHYLIGSGISYSKYSKDSQRLFEVLQLLRRRLK